MFVRFVIPDVDPHGGFFLAVRRLATAIAETGHRCEMMLPATMNSPHLRHDELVKLRRVDSLPVDIASNVTDVISLRCALAAGRPDLLLIGHANFEVLEIARMVAPTVLHAQASWPACPDTARYWSRVGRACSARAGTKCLVLRPLLGCSGRDVVLNPNPLFRWRRLLDLVASGSIGTIAISGPQALLFRDHGLPADKLAVVPNLTMRMRVDEIANAASAIAECDRSAITFFGRLSREKGAPLLPQFAKVAPPPGVRIFGDGYMAKRLRPVLGTVLCGNVSQSRVAGALAWSRATVFPSRWPEPGGIVGLDAQIFGVPLASFAVGAPLDWPATQLFPPHNVGAMAEWLASQPTVVTPREPHVIAARQATYWERVKQRALIALESFASTETFPLLDLAAVTDDLNGALTCSRSKANAEVNVRTTD